jgi:tripartite-type tricarboxylate transporter receptor subunit TctC
VPPPAGTALDQEEIPMKPIIAAVLLLAAGPVCAQGWPTKPIRIVVPFPPGAGPDSIARLMAAPMQEVLGQPWVVENRSGAQGTIATTEVARASPDGYTLMIGTNTTHAANVGLFKKLAYDPLKDFAYVARLAQSALILSVRPDFPATTLREFVAIARAKKGELTAGYGSGGAQVSLGVLQSLAGITTTQVPYKGIPLAAADVLGGQIAATFTDFSVGLPQIRAGKLRGLGVTSRTRSPQAPDIPPIGDELPGFEVTIWWGLMAPAGTPRDIVNRLSAAAIKVLARDDVRAKLTPLGVDVATLASEEFTRFVEAEVPRWVKQIREAGISPE